MTKESRPPDQAPEVPEEPGQEPVQADDSQEAFPSKVVLPPSTREDAIARGELDPEYIGGRIGSSLDPDTRKGRRAKRRAKE